ARRAAPARGGRARGGAAAGPRGLRGRRAAPPPPPRREGLASAVMGALEGVLLRGGYELGGLGASEEAAPLYTGRGWRQWRGPLSVLAPSGMRRIPEEAGNVYVLPVGAPGPDLDGELVCDWRAGDVW
ncbi:hypothetical protein ACFVZS_06710, partial [Streptomyces abikoensis]